jgi:ketosteroid isomerase-like protein
MDVSVERATLLERDAEWARAASEGRDVDRILSYWTDDATVIAPGLPPFVGKAALRGYVEASLTIPGFEISWRSTGVEFSPDGRLAYMFSDNVVSMDGPDGVRTTTPGRVVTIWRRESDGQWRCAVDIWNGG